MTERWITLSSFVLIVWKCAVVTILLNQVIFSPDQKMQGQNIQSQRISQGVRLRDKAKFPLHQPETLR